MSPGWTDKDDEEVPYGKWITHDANTTLLEEHKIRPPKASEEIWPNWNDGVPTRFRFLDQTEPIVQGTVRHERCVILESLELKWSDYHKLSALKNSDRCLPSTRKSEQSGVYRVFLPNVIVDRCCGKDQSGTLYLGMAGEGKGNWSSLRDRIRSIIKGEHHIFGKWADSQAVQEMFKRDDLAVEWAYTRKKPNYKGELRHQALLAERLLLRSYLESFGEYPPFNEKR